MPPEPQAEVKDAAVEGLYDLHDESNQRRGGEELAALLSFSLGKFS